MPRLHQFADQIFQNLFSIVCRIRNSDQQFTQPILLKYLHCFILISDLPQDFQNNQNLVVFQARAFRIKFHDFD